MTYTKSLKQTYDFLIGDFTDLWAIITDASGDFHRGNFLFAALIGTLSQFAIGLTTKGTFGRAFWDALGEINPTYRSIGKPLLEYLAHPLSVYEEAQIWTPGGELDVAISGPTCGWGLSASRGVAKPHLALEDGVLYIRTHQLFEDVKAAIERSGVLEKL